MINVFSEVARRLGGATVRAPLPLPLGVEVVESRFVPRIAGWLSGMAGPAAAVTLGRTILVNPGTRLSERLLKHELAHVEQWERDPRAFPFRYIRAHIRHGYGDNPYEAEARAAETGPSVSGEGA